MTTPNVAKSCRLFRDIFRSLLIGARHESKQATTSKPQPDPCIPDEGVQFMHCGFHSMSPTGLILGVYVTASQGRMTLRLTSASERFNEACCGMFVETLRASGRPPFKGEERIIYNIHPDYKVVVAVGLGEECAGWDDMEEIDHGKEDIRNAAGLGARRLQSLGITRILVESFGHAESAAEGAALGVWRFQDFKNKKKQVSIPSLDLHYDCDFTGWQIGLEKASAQNLARQLTDTPANLLTPTTFAQRAVDVLCNSGINVEIKVQGWAETQKMGAFLGVAKGSCEPPIFLELSYYGTSYDERPVVLIGSGVTYDSGGINLKKHRVLRNMRGDMAGAAVVVATTRALAAMHMPINIRGLVPLCENMPGCAAFKPGDTLTAMNGRTVHILETSAEGRLILADALYYAQNFWPKLIIDVGTLTQEVHDCLGASATGVFTNSDPLWEHVRMAGVHTGDRVWRLPLWNYFSRQVNASLNQDMCNIGRGGHTGGVCKAAAFLREFVPCGDWMHFDTYGVNISNGKENTYLGEGMSGRPTRTLIEFISQMICKICPSLTKVSHERPC